MNNGSAQFPIVSLTFFQRISKVFLFSLFW